MTTRKTSAKSPAKSTRAAAAPARKTRPPAKTGGSTANRSRSAAGSTASGARARLATASGFVGSVEAAIAALPLGPGDAAAAHLARAYAAALDRPRLVAERDDALDRVGPKLLLALAALGGTPASRHRLTGRPHTPNPDEGRPTPPAPMSTTPGLDELRRVHGRG